MRRLGFVPYSGFQTIVNSYTYSSTLSNVRHDFMSIADVRCNGTTHTRTSGQKVFILVKLFSTTRAAKFRYSLIWHRFPRGYISLFITQTRYSKDSNKTQHIPHIYCLTNESRLFSSIISGRVLGCEWVAVASVHVVRGNTGWVAAVLYHFKQFSVLVQF